MSELAEAGIRIEEVDGEMRVHLTSREALELAPWFLPPTPKRKITSGGGEIWIYAVKEWGS